MPGQEPIIPPELEGIIEIYENLYFVDFYNLLHSMVRTRGAVPFGCSEADISDSTRPLEQDVMLPAFKLEHYLESRASSTMAAGLIAAASFPPPKEIYRDTSLNPFSFVRSPTPRRSPSWLQPERSLHTVT
jgi:hypothetical protein